MRVVGVEFDEFAREQLPALGRFAAALTGDRQLANDLVQDTMVRAYLRWGWVSAVARPELYLRRMLVNAYRSWRRRWYQRSVRHVAAVPEASVPDEHQRVDDRGELTALLAKLTRRQRTAIVLRFYEDRDDSEIAQVLGCSQATVRSHIFRGLAALRLRAETRPEPAVEAP